MTIANRVGRGIALACATLVAGGGAMALVGHFADHDNLLRLFVDGPPVLPDTALGLTLAGFALAGQARTREDRRASSWVRIIAGAVLAIAALQLLDDFFALFAPYSFERLRLIDEPMGLAAPPQSALGLAVAGSALLLATFARRTSRSTAEWMGFMLFCAALLGAAAHLYEAFALALLPGFGAIPLGPVIGFLVLGAGIPFALHRHEGLVALISSRTGGGTLLRTVVPQALALFVFAGWLQLTAFSHGWVDYRYGSTLFAGTGFVVLFMLMWRAARRINRLEGEKEEIGEQYLAILRTAPDAVIVCNENGRILLTNRKVKNLFGYGREEAQGRSLNDLLPDLALDGLDGLLGTLAPGSDAAGGSTPLTGLRADGSGFIANVSLGLRQTRRGKIIIAIVRDATAKFERERELHRANRALRLISTVAQAARREQNEEKFIVEACRTIVEGGYIAAWFGRAGPAPVCRVLPVTGSGPDKLREFLARIHVTWDDTPTGRGAGGTSIRTGKPCVIRDALADPQFAPWRDFAQEVGFRSVAGFPLRVGGRIEGTLLIYAAADHFGNEECVLLGALADDMGYAIAAIRAGTSRNETELALRRSEASLARAQQIAHLGSWEWDLHDSMQWSDQVFELFGVDLFDTQASVAAMRAFAHPDDRDALDHTLAQVQRGEVSAARCQFRAVRPDGTVAHLDLQAEVEFDDTGACRVVGVLQDVSERVRFEEELAKLARYDALTGLPNRHLLQDRLEQAMTHARRLNRMLALAFVDLDRFKIVNDTLGHDAGDQLLKEVARRLVACLRPGDTVARQGGDEFVVVLTDLAKPEDAAYVAQKMLESLTPPVQLAGQEVMPGASMGVALFPRDGAGLQELMMNADKAMYSAKHAGRGQYRFYDAEMNRSAEDWLEITGSLHRALERNEFLLHYQPKLAIHGGTTGVEALLRWHSPEHGLVGPAKFIPLLEETGRIIEVGEWVIREACRQVRRWRDEAGMDVRVAVNLSLRQFQQSDLVERVKRIIAEEGVPADSLELEITESTVAQNVERAIAIMHAFKRCGLRLAIDDFGTGYSSLAALKRFPVDCLKIDRSFVQDLPDDPDSATIARAIVALAHSMELTVVAEGVETDAQYRFLVECGCDEIQGYLLARPMPADDVVQLLSAPRPAMAAAAEV